MSQHEGSIVREANELRIPGAFIAMNDGRRVDPMNRRRSAAAEKDKCSQKNEGPQYTAHRYLN
jgi:hypothetical protein